MKTHAEVEEQLQERNRSNSGNDNNSTVVIDPPAIHKEFHKERRKDPRSSFTAAAVTLEPGSGARLDARTSDLSSGGCYVDTMNPFPPGTDVELRLTKGGRSFNANARVVYCQSGIGMGMLFASATAEDMSTLRHWLAETRGEAAPERQCLPASEMSVDSDYSKSSEHFVLEELLLLLSRKEVLTEEDVEPLLHRLMG